MCPAGVLTSVLGPLLLAERGEEAGQGTGLVGSNGGVPREPSMKHRSWDRIQRGKMECLNQLIGEMALGRDLDVLEAKSIRKLLRSTASRAC